MEKEFLSSYHPQVQQEATDPRAQYFCEVDLLANHHDCGLSGRLLIKHVSRG